jgi:hypothetical protein
MEDGVAVAELKSTERHCHPRLDVRRQEDKRAVFDDHLKVSVKKLKHKVKILL